MRRLYRLSQSQHRKQFGASEPSLERGNIEQEQARSEIKVDLGKRSKREEIVRKAINFDSMQSRQGVSGE